MNMHDLNPSDRAVLREPEAAVRYQLIVENVGEDTYILMSKGHHDPHEFMRAVRADYSWPLGMPTHEWMRAIPAPKGSGYRCLYVEAEPRARGAFPATYAREAYGEDSYERLCPQQTASGCSHTAEPNEQDQSGSSHE